MTIGRLSAALAALVLVAGSGCASDAGSGGSPDPSASAVGDPSAGEGRAFTSSVYGYSAVGPPGWSAAPATSPWDGGDIGHEAGYADRFDGGGSGFLFTIGTPTDLPLEEFADAHVAWLTQYRCPDASTRVAPMDTAIDGVPAVRLALACPSGIYGPTLISKAVVVRDGVGVIFTAFSPDSGSESFPAFDDLLASVRWAGS